MKSAKKPPPERAGAEGEDFVAPPDEAVAGVDFAGPPSGPDGGADVTELCCFGVAGSEVPPGPEAPGPETPRPEPPAAELSLPAMPGAAAAGVDPEFDVDAAGAEDVAPEETEAMAAPAAATGAAPVLAASGLVPSDVELAEGASPGLTGALVFPALASGCFNSTAFALLSGAAGALLSVAAAGGV
ncbi:hypothetical protein [Szabonella alba]|uniref:Uncharacterized protein n=1 Tax=Szabonella alba TaxID=2804194 RepID=A0A8K0V7Y5_9RHOB|nr:hypothetical protein [Szabonella alba]MBL4916796.1 hypothetical protein [Szabonella alba]